MTKDRFFFPVIAIILIGITVYAVYTVFGILGNTEKHLNAGTQSLITDLSRTEIHNTTFQNAAKVYFASPSEEQKTKLRHLGNVLRSRLNLLQPEMVIRKFPHETEKSLKEEIGYIDNAFMQLNLILDKPDLLKAKQKEIENQLKIVNTGLAFVFTETVIAVHNLSIQQQSALKGLFETIVFLSCFLVIILLALVYFMLKFHNQSKLLKHEVNLKNRFFSILAHDLQGPFNALLGMTQMMSQVGGNVSREKMSEYSADVNEAGERVFKLLKNLLEWSRLQITGANLDPKIIKLDILTQESINILNPIALEKDISIINNTKIMNAFADQDMVKSIIRNLISNALKFTQSGGEIEVSTHNTKGFVQVTVRDTGVGMTAKQLENIFSLDQQTSTTGTAGETGTGLGLPLCKDMLERNGGHIWAESILGNGSQFYFTLPIGPGKI